MDNTQTAIRDEGCFPVSVIMTHERVNWGRWQIPRWQVEGVLAGETVQRQGTRQGTLIHENEGKRHYLWSGFSIHLHKDSSESYWLNLVGMQPSLFVVCQEDPIDGGCAPQLVTANYDEAGAYMEADATVMSTPMPPEVYRWLERYVMENFQPVEGKSRKRKAWFDPQQAEKMPPRGQRQRGES